jgi:hypothetical protein
MRRELDGMLSRQRDIGTGHLLAVGQSPNRKQAPVGKAGLGEDAPILTRNAPERALLISEIAAFGGDEVADLVGGRGAPRQHYGHQRDNKKATHHFPPTVFRTLPPLSKTSKPAKNLKVLRFLVPKTTFVVG